MIWKIKNIYLRRGVILFLAPTTLILYVFLLSSTGLYKNTFVGFRYILNETKLASKMILESWKGK